MSEFLDLRNLLQETNATLERLEREIAQSPHDWSLALTAESLRHRQADLEDEFAFLANVNMLDVCDYRLIPAYNEDYPIISVTRALASFQELVTTVFDAYKTQPKIRARFTADIVAGSTLSFGYAYPGSLGFVLTMPNERMLFGESELDRAIQTIFEMAKAERPAQLAAYVARVGVASIRRLYAWSQSHAEFGLSVDIRWRRQREDRARLVVQKEELARLREIIDQASEEKTEPFTVTGELIGLDIGSGNHFRISVPLAEDVYGWISDSFDRASHYEIHGRFTADLIKRSKIYYSTEREDEWWELVRLRAVPN
jgi:hypothetical protein